MAENFEKKNTVKGEGQMVYNVFFDGAPKASPRILIMGNSITKHEPLAEIGWYNNWGMAASSQEKDYVHRLMTKIRERRPNATFCIVQAAVWEVSYTDCDFDKHFADAKDFCPDIIVCAISSNIRDELFDHDAFMVNMGKLHDYLGMRDGVRLVQTTSFFNNERKNAAIKDYVAGRGGDLVYISDLPSDPSNLAIGEYEHEGIQHHPGDKGMEEMASRIFEVVKKHL